MDSFKGAYNKDSARVPMMRLPIFIMVPYALRAYGSGVLSIWGCRFAWTVEIGTCDYGSIPVALSLKRLHGFRVDSSTLVNPRPYKPRRVRQVKPQRVQGFRVSG